MEKNIRSELKGFESKGKRVSVYWDFYEKWYTGVVVQYDPIKNLYKIQYDDGDFQWEEDEAIVPIDHGSLYVVDKLLDKKTSRKRSYYLVKWVGFEETTWEPAVALEKCWIKEFEALRKKRRKMEENVDTLDGGPIEDMIHKLEAQEPQGSLDLIEPFLQEMAAFDEIFNTQNPSNSNEKWSMDDLEQMIQQGVELGPILETELNPLLEIGSNLHLEVESSPTFETESNPLLEIESDPFVGADMTWWFLSP